MTEDQQVASNLGKENRTPADGPVKAQVAVDRRRFVLLRRVLAPADCVSDRLAAAGHHNARSRRDAVTGDHENRFNQPHSYQL